MLKDAGATAVILGHSERRHGLGEDDALVKAKAETALAAGLVVVLCIGETEDEYLAGERDAVLARQLDGSLPEGGTADTLVVAYEPVWAIGTGRTPSLAEIDETHQHLRQMLTERTADGCQDGAALWRLGQGRQCRRHHDARPMSTAPWSAAPASMPMDFGASTRLAAALDAGGRKDRNA